MQLPVITFDGLERSGAVESRILEISKRLRRCNDRITHCHVTVNGSSGGPYPAVSAKIHISVPGAQIHADSHSTNGVRHTDVFLALRHAYENARRQLQDLKRDARCTSPAG